MTQRTTGDRMVPSTAPAGLRPRGSTAPRPAGNRAGLRPAPAAPSLARALHQHDLTDAAAARLVQLAQVKAGERVVEPGSGSGVLTAALLAAGARVWAVELDPRRCDLLRERCADAVADERLRIVLGDAVREPVDPGGPWR
ncbi:MAG: rRNA ((1518)-N(6)/adenine(1519)-N(6))-dimethyltransferase RsmA, partial [Planctomycetota bacterium]